MQLGISAGDGTVLASLSDETAGWSEGLSAPDRLRPSQATVMTSERGTAESVRPLADFMTVRFRGSHIDGRPYRGILGISRMLTRHGLVKAEPSNFRRGPGSFAVTWLHR